MLALKYKYTGEFRLCMGQEDFTMQYTFNAALLIGLDRARIGAEHAKNQRKVIGYITEYFGTHKPAVKHWSDLTVEDLREYIAHLESRGLSPCTIRAYTNPFRLAHRATRTEVGAEYLKMRDLLPKREPTEKRFLTFAQVRKAIHLADRNRLHAGYFCLVMGAYAGLRMTEAMRVTPGDYDATAGVLTIGANERKTSDSERMIPLVRAAQEALDWHFATPSTSHRFRHRAEAGYTSQSSVNKQVREILQTAYAATGDPAYTLVKPSEAGRKTFANVCQYEAGIDRTEIRVYCGHSPDRWDTLARHYLAQKATPRSMPHVREAALNRMRQVVVNPLAKLF